MKYASYRRASYNRMCDCCKANTLIRGELTGCAQHARRAALADRDPDAVAELDRDLDRMTDPTYAAGEPRREAELSAYYAVAEGAR